MYDYVIVGAGSAGCVLASRLSEDPDVQVLLLEAGPPDTNENIHVPLGYLQLGRTEVDWDYCSAPEQECDERRIPLPRGKVLGGSSSINAMVYIRGNRRDYDEWGVPGWGSAELMPYFLKAEDNERGASRWHGVGGPLPVSEERSGNPMSRAFVEAGVQAGFARNEDFNGDAQDGVGMYQVTQRGGMRASTAVAYLHPAMERANLTVMPYMHVHRVLFEGTRAVGVEASQLGQLQELRAEREVILCGGAYNSPQLLMLSGIGAAEHLTMREIEVVLDQPAVGENLSDHPATQPSGRRPSRRACCLRSSPRRWRVRSDADRPVRVELRGGGRLRACRAGCARAGHPVPRRAAADHRRGHDRPGGARRVGVAVPAHAAQQGHRAPRLERPDGEADRAQRLLHRRR